MLYCIKFKKINKFLNVKSDDITDTLFDTRFFKKADAAKAYAVVSMPSKLRSFKWEIRQVPNLHRLNGYNHAVFSPGIKYVDEKLDTSIIEEPEEDKITMPSTDLAKPKIEAVTEPLTSKVADTPLKLQFEAYLTEMNNKFASLSKELSALDLEQQDILHHIELNTLDAVARIKLMNALIDIRKRRRICKEEFSQAQILCSALNKIKFVDERTFEYSSSIVTDVLEGTTHDSI